MSSKRQAIRRRAFLASGLGASVSCSRQGEPGWRFFSGAEARTVDAICEQIIPRDEDAGAHDAGVVNYIDLQLTRSFRRYQRVYREGIAAVEAAGRKKFGQDFAGLPPDQQSEVLQEVEENSKTFFDLIVTHTRQGFYGDPRHGGNQGRVSWKMLGLASPPVRGRQHYREDDQG